MKRENTQFVQVIPQNVYLCNAYTLKNVVLFVITNKYNEITPSN